MRALYFFFFQKADCSNWYVIHFSSFVWRHCRLQLQHSGVQLAGGRCLGCKVCSSWQCAAIHPSIHPSLGNAARMLAGLQWQRCSCRGLQPEPVCLLPGRAPAPLLQPWHTARARQGDGKVTGWSLEAESRGRQRKTSAQGGERGFSELGDRATGSGTSAERRTESRTKMEAQELERGGKK